MKNKYRQARFATTNITVLLVCVLFMTGCWETVVKQIQLIEKEIKSEPSNIKSKKALQKKVEKVSVHQGPLPLIETNEKGPEALESYPYWPGYKKFPISEIQAQDWIGYNHTIEGWDFSLPPETQPSERSIIALDRYIGLNKKITAKPIQFNANMVTIHWVFWKEIEVEEGIYNWDLIKERILETKAKGTDTVLRILGHAIALHGNPQKRHVPEWLNQYDIKTKTHSKKGKLQSINYDPSDPIFHKYYLALIDSFHKSGIPSMPELRAAYVGYDSHSLGDEGIGPKGMDPHNEPQHVKERLDVWAKAFKGMEHKVFMGGPSFYGFNIGFGVRRGFVERYLYTLPDPIIGQYLDDQGYLYVDEEAPVIKMNCFNGEVNEEYEEAWITKERGFRFGKTLDSFSYRYFVSNLRALQMRCSYIHNKDTLISELLPYVALQLGRTVEDSPDIWCDLRESYIKKYKNQEKKNRIPKGKQVQVSPEYENVIPCKNFERWLYQRDSVGYETEPVLKVTPPDGMWMIPSEKYEDYIARKGQRIGLSIDERFLGETPENVCVKVTYLDKGAEQLRVHIKGEFQTKEYSIPLNQTGKLLTKSLFISDFQLGSNNGNYNIIIEGIAGEAIVSFVRVVKL